MILARYLVTEVVSMYVETLGEESPEIAIVGGIHGDEPCGVHAIEALLDEAPAVERPVKVIIANQQALDQDKRFIDTDLNRAFPGNSDAEEYERRLAADLLAELRGCRTLALHSTQSTAKPFALVTETGPLAETICPRLSIDALVEAKACVDTALGAHVDAIEIECGLQGTEQASANAEQLVREFLGATGALAEPIDTSERVLPVYRLQEPIPKPPATAYAVHVPNFERVAEGERYATSDDKELIAEEPFYPVLLSSDGYDTQFGYAADLTDRLEPAAAPIGPERASEAVVPEVSR
jgi:predicted deacylase